MTVNDVVGSISNWIEVVGLIFTSFSVIYEILGYLRRRPDDPPNTVLQYAIALVCYVIFILTGKKYLFYNRLVYKKNYSQTLDKKVSLSIEDDVSIRRSAVNIRTLRSIRYRNGRNKSSHFRDDQGHIELFVNDPSGGPQIEGQSQ